MGLLPGFDGDYLSRSVALINNECGNFPQPVGSSAGQHEVSCVFTKGIVQADFPVRHGEGKLYAADAVIQRLQEDQQMPCGMRGRMATLPAAGFRIIQRIRKGHRGICDPTGRIFGLMPHPEAYHDWTNHTRLDATAGGGSAVGRTLWYGRYGGHPIVPECGGIHPFSLGRPRTHRIHAWHGDRNARRRNKKGAPESGAPFRVDRRSEKNSTHGQWCPDSRSVEKTLFSNR